MKTTIPIPPRPEYTRRSLSSASFQGQLRNASTQLPGDKLASSASADELITTLDGKTIRVIDTKYTIQPSTSIAIPSCPTLPSTENLVATLFRTGTCDSTSTIAGEQIVPEIAVLSFVQIITALSVPYISPRASHRILTPTNAVVEIAFTMSANLSLRDLRRHEDIHAFSEKWGISVVLQRNDVFRRYKRLVVFDMDSTLIQQEVIDEVAEVVGVKDEVAAITARSMAGELDFEQSLRHRVKLLKGVPATVWEQLKREGKITLMPGARELCHALRLLGYKTAVLSGGFVPMAEWVKAELGLDYAHANQLTVSDDGKEITGELEGDIVHAERKAELLQSIAKENGILLDQTMAIGDGANDLKMMHVSGLGIAFNAKPAAQFEAPCRINSISLTDVLYVLGLSADDQAALGVMERL